MKLVILALIVFATPGFSKNKVPSPKKLPVKAKANPIVESQELAGMKLTGELERVNFPLTDDMDSVINQDIVLMPAELNQ